MSEYLPTEKSKYCSQMTLRAICLEVLVLSNCFSKSYSKTPVRVLQNMKVPWDA